MSEQFENNYETLLNGAINNSVTTITVDTPPTTMTRNFRIRIDDEIILVGAVSGNDFTGCTRGVEGTSAASHLDNAPVTHVLTAGALNFVREYPLDAYTVDATYGDDFNESSLNARWTRRNFTSGAETYQQGKNATYMRIAQTSRAAGDGYFQTAPGGDWTIAMAYVPYYWPASRLSWSICVIDSSGTGVGMTFYDSPHAGMVAGITTYSTYSGSFQQEPSYGGSAMSLTFAGKVWKRLRKSSTNYYGSISFNGETWGPETPAFSSSITVDRIGMIVHPLPGTQTTAYVDVDWFNKIA